MMVDQPPHLQLQRAQWHPRECCAGPSRTRAQELQSKRLNVRLLPNFRPSFKSLTWSA
jgi:hypothetical protein